MKYQNGEDRCNIAIVMMLILIMKRNYGKKEQWLSVHHWQVPKHRKTC